MATKAAALAWCMLAAVSVRADAGAEARLIVEVDGPVLLGEMLKVDLEVVSPTPFIAAPLFPDLELEGAVALQAERMGMSFSERRGRDTWFGVRKRYLVFPQREGGLELPALVVRFGVGTGAPRVTTRRQMLEVLAPEVDVPLGQLVVTPRLRLSQSFDGDLASLVVGDAVRRQVSVEAENTLGLVLPTITFAAPDGIAVYQTNPAISDTTARGQYRGARIESVTYMLTRPGRFELPAINVYWLNPALRQLETETLPAVELVVAAGSVPSGMERAERRDLATILARFAALARRHIAEVSIGVLGVYVAWQLGRRVLPPLVAGCVTVRRRRRDSEARRFRALLRAIRAGDPDLKVASFWRWVDRVRPGGAWTALDRDGRFAPVWREEEARRYRNETGATVDVERLIGALRHLRASINRVPEVSESLNPRNGHWKSRT